jgi:uncharacterized membrane protein
VAIGFAFRDILQNFLAGILLLLTEPFRIDDQIIVKEFEGTVEDIQTRATMIRTYDGRRIVIPNAELFTESVIVNTAFEKRRLEYDVGIGYGDDIERAKALILEAIAGVVFSVTIVALSLASQQFGPRLLRNFMRDVGNRVVLGTFIATFVYCLLVLLAVGRDGGEFVPYLSVTAAMALALVSLGVLISFIHHVAASISAANLIDHVGVDLHEAIDRLFPEKVWREAAPEASPREPLPEAFERQARGVAAARSSYLQDIDSDSLMQIAVRYDVVLRLPYRPGHFITQGSDIALVWPGDRLDEGLAEQITDAFIVGVERTLTQDVEVAIDQLVEIAVRALSPGVNDPFTAMLCLDRLSEALCHVLERPVPSPHRYDDAQRLRIVAHPLTFAGMVDAAFNQIRQYGRSSAAVTIRLLEAIARVASRARREEDRMALLRHAGMVLRGSQTGLPEEWDRRDVMERFQAVLKALEKG